MDRSRSVLATNGLEQQAILQESSSPSLSVLGKACQLLSPPPSPVTPRHTSNWHWYEEVLARGISGCKRLLAISQAFPVPSERVRVVVLVDVSPSPCPPPNNDNQPVTSSLINKIQHRRWKRWRQLFRK